MTAETDEKIPMEFLASRSVPFVTLAAAAAAAVVLVLVIVAGMDCSGECWK